MSDVILFLFWLGDFAEVMSPSSSEAGTGFCSRSRRRFSTNSSFPRFLPGHPTFWSPFCTMKTGIHQIQQTIFYGGPVIALL
ncbi:hypothetical protein TNCT_77601 [Trichonephila clavata]|uniref:Secreted protein n=1 Tax=Trichonephila clavata TaxID=2740835 RepID=A0A8X6KG28_TRICU|nr:hypothetical protein TNCT_77601 [Trichonephila clavata]